LPQPLPGLPSCRRARSSVCPSASDQCLTLWGNPDRKGQGGAGVASGCNGLDGIKDAQNS
jgi:hypothetical protein